MNFDSPFVDVRVCWQPPVLRSSHAIGLRLPALLLLALISWIWRAAAAAGSTSRRLRRPAAHRPRRPTPPGRNGPGSAARRWSMAARPTATSTAAGINERSEPLNSRIGDYWGSCGHPEWNGRTSGRPWSGAFVVLGDGPFRRQRRATSRATAGTAAISRRSTTASSTAAAARLRAARAQRICAQAGRPRLHRHGRPDLAPCRFAHRAAAHRQHREPLRHRHRRARRLSSTPIGGNVKNSVTMSLYPVDSRGRLVPFAGKTWFMVVEKRV